MACSVHEARERLPHLDLDSYAARFVVVPVDEHLVQQRLVQLPLDVLWRGGVSEARNLEEVQSIREVVLDLFVTDLVVLQTFGDVGERRGDTVLLRTEKVDRNRVGVVGLEKFLSSAFELLLLLGESGYLVVSSIAAHLNLIPDCALDPSSVALAELDGASVVLFDSLLDVGDERSTLVAI